MTTAVIERIDVPGPVTVDGDRTGASHREAELGAIIDAYNQVTEKLKASHDTLAREVRRLTRQIAEKDRELERRRRLAALGEMAAGVAHEVRNPLGGILLYATMLERDLRSMPAARAMAERIAGAARNLDGVVGDVLTFSNPQEPQRRAVVFNELIADVVDLLGPQRIERRCTVRVDAPAEAIEAHIDPAQVQRAVLNVLSNAIDAAGDDGHVWITLTLEAECREGNGDAHRADVCVSVADDGPGVPDDLREHIFDPFFTTKERGTGLGLAIVHGIVEAHQGRVEVRSRCGGGTVFALWFPACGRRLRKARRDEAENDRGGSPKEARRGAGRQAQRDQKSATSGTELPESVGPGGTN